MKKLLAVLLAVAMICALGVTAFADDAVAPKDGGSKVTFTTGGEAGTYYGFGSVLAQKVSDVTSTNVTAITSGGSAANIDAIDIGDAQLGFSQSDVLAYAYAGERTFEEIGAIDSFSIVAPLYMEQVQIVTLNPDIKTVADLKGKAVSIGAAGSAICGPICGICGCCICCRIAISSPVISTSAGSLSSACVISGGIFGSNFSCQSLMMSCFCGMSR